MSNGRDRDVRAGQGIENLRWLSRIEMDHVEGYRFTVPVLQVGLSQSTQENIMKKAKDKNIRERKRADGSVRGWEVRYRDADSLDSRGYPMVRGKVFPTLDEARDWQAEHRLDVKHGRFISPDRSRTPFLTVAEKYLDMRGDDLRNRTQGGYRSMLAGWLGDWHERPIDGITPDDVERVLRSMREATDSKGNRKPRSAQTQHRVFNLMSSIFGYAQDMKYISSDPTSGMRRHLPSVSRNRFKGRALTPTEAMAIIKALPEGRFQTYALLGYYSGFRAGELAGLRVKNLNPFKNTVQVGETVEDLSGSLRPGTPKTDDSRDRIVPIPVSVMKDVMTYVATEGLQPDDYVFAGPNEFFSQKNFYNRHWKSACKEAGFWDAEAKRVTVRFHDLRITFASLRARAGVPPHKLRLLMGHSDINTTMNIYVQAFGGDPEDTKFAERIYELTESGEAISDADVQRIHDAV